jgi:hypothetical protein
MLIQLLLHWYVIIGRLKLPYNQQIIISDCLTEKSWGFVIWRQYTKMLERWKLIMSNSLWQINICYMVHVVHWLWQINICYKVVHWLWQINMLYGSSLVVTDSNSVQKETPSILRITTEYPKWPSTEVFWSLSICCSFHFSIE